MTDFDPYQQWLGIPAAMRPLNHYLVLGISLYEEREQIIRKACDQKMELVRQHQSGPRGDICEQILTEITQAKQVLLDEENRRQYDIALKKSFEESIESDPEESESTQSEKFDFTSQRKPESNGSQKVPANDRNTDSNTSLDVSQLEPQSNFNAKNISIFSAVILITTLATVFLLSQFNLGPKGHGSTATSEDPVQAAKNEKTNPSTSDLKSEIVESEVNSSTKLIKWAGSTTEQNPKAELLMLPANAEISGENMSRISTGISGWSAKGDSATWLIDVEDRRTSFFHCDITYQSNKECRMQVKIGEQTPRSFSIYPNQDAFTERFFVRLGEGKQLFQVSVVDIESTAKPNLQQIKLIPK